MISQGVEASDLRIMRSVHSAEEVTGDKETPQTSLIRRQADSGTEGSNTALGWWEAGSATWAGSRLVLSFPTVSYSA